MSLRGWLQGEKPCEYYTRKKCPWADEKSDTCIKAGGGRYCGGFRALENLDKEGKL